MGYIGNTKGPRKSVIAKKLGAGYFGITDDELEDEIQIYKDEESLMEIDPVYLDKNRKPYLIFNAPGKKTQKYYLDEYGYKLKGKILAWITL